MPHPFCLPGAPVPLPRSIRIAALLPGLFLLAVPIVQAAEAMTPSPLPAPSADVASSASPALLGTYRKWQDAPVADWAAANERVGEIGGWQTYLRDAQASENAPNAGDHSRHGQ